jgi:F0F1-type ATP synthase membrane subunit b/b'
MAAEGGEGGGSWSILIFFAINFALFVFILYHFGAPPAGKFFTDRATGIRGTLDRANNAFAQAQDLANKAAARVAGLATEKARMQRELDDETAHLVRRIGELAAQGAERIRRDAELTAAALGEAAQRRLRTRLAAAAAAMARDLIAREFNDSDQSRLLQGFMNRLGQEART